MGQSLFPGSTCGDRQFLVVVAMASTGSKSVTEPEIVLLGNCIRGIGKVRSSLVRCHHQIWVVSIPANHSLGTDHLTINDVVSETQQSLDEDLVEIVRLFTTLGSVGMRMPKDKTTLCSYGNDQDIFDHLRPLESMDLGSVISDPVRPA